MGIILPCRKNVKPRQPSIVHRHLRGRVSIVSTPSIAKSSKEIVICLHDYKEAKSGKKCKVGDRLQVYGEIDDEWLKVLNLSTNDITFIPIDYVSAESRNEIEDCFFGYTTRREAERYLMGQNTLIKGSYLIRYSESKEDSCVLSVLDRDDDGDFHVVHYWIVEDQDRFIINGQTYSTLSNIVSTYKTNKIISKPCKKPPPHLWDLDVAHKRNWELDRDDLELAHVIDEGNFAKVYLAFWKNSTKVAVKILKQQSIDKDELLREASIMKQFRHPGLLTLYGICSKSEPTYLVLEYMENGDLRKFLRNDGGNKLKFKDLIDIAFQVSSGMEHLELKKLVHRDLAARNILVTNNNIVKIGDFGLALLLHDNKCNNYTTTIAIKWSAPEAIKSGEFTTKSDIWSYGIFLVELFTYGETPYPGLKIRDVVGLVNNGYRIPKPSELVPDNVYNVMLNCWESIPEKRISFREITAFLMTFIDTDYL